MQIGERIKINLHSYELTSHWDTPFGVTYLYTFKDFSDNIFIWKTPKLIEENVHTIAGRIKEITCYNQTKEFVLNYCKVNM